MSEVHIQQAEQAASLEQLQEKQKLQADKNIQDDHGEGLSLGQKAQQELLFDTDNDQIQAEDDVNEQMLWITKKLQLEKGSSTLKTAENVFLFLNFDNALRSQFFKDVGSPLPKLQRLASYCDLAFKEKVVSAIKSDAKLEKLGQFYKAASANHQKAFLDVVATFLISVDFHDDVEAESGLKLDPKLTCQIQGGIGELMASTADEVETAVAKLEQILDKLPSELKEKSQNTLSVLRLKIKILAQNKLQAAADIKARHESYQQACADLQKLDCDSFRPKTLGYQQNVMQQGIPAQCGLNMLLDEGELQQLNYTVEYELKPQVDKVIAFSHQLDDILASHNLKGNKLSDVQNLIREQGSDNAALHQKLVNYSHQELERLHAEVASLLASPQSNRNLTLELSKLGTSIRTKLLPEDAKALCQLLSSTLSNPHFGIDTLTDTPNLRALRHLMGKVSQNPRLQAHFGDLMELLSTNRFDFNSFALLDGLPADLNTLSARSTAVLEQFVTALDDTGAGIEFINSLGDKALNSREARHGFTTMLKYFSTSTDPLTSQLCGKYLHLNMLSLAASLDVQSTEYGKLQTPPLPEEFAAHPELYQDFKVQFALNALVAGKPSELDSDTLKLLLSEAVAGRLPHLGRVWNTLLNTAYHTEMADLLKQGKITSVPKRLSSLNLEAAAPGQRQVQTKTGADRVRDDFISSLSQEVKDKISSQSMGLVRKDEQQETIDKITKSLNSVTEHNSQMLEMLRLQSSAGKREAALDEMRRELILINHSVVTKGTQQYQDIKTAASLVKVSVDKGAFFNAINKSYGQVSAEYAQLNKDLNAAIQNPALTSLLEAQGLKPGQQPQGEEVAVTLALLRDNLIDDLADVNADDLRALGFREPEHLKLSAEEIAYGLKLNQVKAKAALLNLTDPKALPEAQGEEFSQEKVEQFHARCDAVLTELKELIARDGGSSPLTKVTKLALSKYLQFSILRHGDDYTQFVAKRTGTAYLQSHDPDDPETFRQAQQLTFEKNLELSSLLGNFARGQFSADKNADLTYIRQLVLNDLCESVGFDSSTLKQFNQGVLESRLDSAGKRELISSLKLKGSNIDLASFTLSNTLGAQHSPFSDALNQLAKTEDAKFDAALQSFISNYLTSGNLNKADALLTYARYEGTAEDGAGTALGSALDEAALKSSPQLKQLATSFIKDYRQTVGSATRSVGELSKAQSEQIATVGKKLLSDNSVRSQLRIAGSYAAAELGYASKNDLYTAYHKGSDEFKAQVVEKMTEALIERGLDSNLADILVRGRLQEGKSEHVFARMWSMLKNTFFSTASYLQERLGSRLDLNGTEHLRREKNYLTYLPAITEMVKGVTADTIKYVDQNTQFSFKFNPLKAIDAVTGMALSENEVLALKLSLSLFDNSGMIFNRTEDHKLHLTVNTEILGGVGVDLSAAKVEENAGASLGASLKIGGGRVLELQFDSDEEASVFICKMYTGQLSSEDVRLASEASIGSNFKLNAGLSAGLNIGSGVTGKIMADEVEQAKLKQPGKSVNVGEVLSEKHPIVSQMLNYTSLGDVRVGSDFTYKTKYMVDDSGYLVESDSRWTNEVTFSSGSVGGKYQDEANLLAGKLKGVSTAIDKIEQIKKDTDKKVNEVLNAPLKSLGIDQVENQHAVHISDITGTVDEAVDTTVCNRLKEGHFQLLRDLGMLTDEGCRQLQQAQENGSVVSVRFVMKLKQSVIDELQDSPTLLLDAAKDVAANYEFESVQLEFAESGNSTADYDWLKRVTLGMFSYKSKASASGHTLVTLTNNAV
ncbi:MAG: hypothetical protein K6F05_00045 [Succinivibrio sp.]|nr:hypothetical protein [Succinivibrio sp.]